VSSRGTPDLPPGDVAEVLEVRDTERADPATVAQLEGLYSREADENVAAGDKRILDILDDLPPTHRSRMGLRVTLEYVSAAGVSQMVPGCWEDDLPTQARVASLVGSRTGLRPGTYRVLLRQGRRTMPHIRYNVAPPIMLESSSAAGGDTVAGVIEMAKAMREASQPAAEPMEPAALSSLASELEATAGDVEALTDRLEAVEVQLAQLAQLAQGLIAGQNDKPDAGGFDLGQLLELGKSLSGMMPAPAPVEASA